MTIEDLLLALTLFLGRAPPPHTVSYVYDAATDVGVPPELVAALCTLESRMGTDPRAVSLCGTRVRGRYEPDPESSAWLAASSLGHWWATCRTWPRAIVAWRYGRGCAAPDPFGYAARALALAARLRRGGGR
jgi:hypothetical protein